MVRWLRRPVGASLRLADYTGRIGELALPLREGGVSRIRVELPGGRERMLLAVSPEPRALPSGTRVLVLGIDDEGRAQIEPEDGNLHQGGQRMNPEIWIDVGVWSGGTLGALLAIIVVLKNFPDHRQAERGPRVLRTQAHAQRRDRAGLSRRARRPFVPRTPPRKGRRDGHDDHAHRHPDPRRVRQGEHPDQRRRGRQRQDQQRRHRWCTTRSSASWAAPGSRFGRWPRRRSRARCVASSRC